LTVPSSEFQESLVLGVFGGVVKEVSNGSVGVQLADHVPDGVTEHLIHDAEYMYYTKFFIKLIFTGNNLIKKIMLK
jgi:hypothetical protein